MPPKRERLPVVLDTNVLVGQLLSKTRRSANSRVFDLRLVRRELQLVFSPPLVEEYFELLGRLCVAEERIARFRERLRTAATVTRVNLGKRFKLSRDTDDDFLLATAHAGRARYLVTNDRDLLEIPRAKDSLSPSRSSPLPTSSAPSDCRNFGLNRLTHRFHTV